MSVYNYYNKPFNMRTFFKIISFLLLVAITDKSFAQNGSTTDTTISIDALTTPISPGSVLLGVNPNDIQKPTELTGIWTSVRNATNNFSSFPNSFAIDIAPKWVFGKKSITYEDFIGNKKVFGQTFNISYSQVSQNDTNYTGLKQGIGFSFSIFRGKIQDKKYLSTIASILTIDSILNISNKSRLDYLRQNDSTYKKLKNQGTLISAQLTVIFDGNNPNHLSTDSLVHLLDSLNNLIAAKDVVFLGKAKQYADSVNVERINNLKTFENAIVPVRKGLFLNLSAGTIVKYDNFKSNSSSLTNKSVWLNFGYDGLNTDTAGKSYLSFILLSRLIADNADELFKSGSNTKLTTWDNGLRVAYTTNNQKLSFSGEGLARKIFNESGDAFVYKYSMSIDVRVSKNQRLTLSYGKDFNNHVTKDGNIFGYINFIAGLFNSKTFTTK